MPTRRIVAKELADIFKVLAHPDRIRMLEDLRANELDVNSIAEQLGLPSPRVSQHLGLLRAHRLVEERREGRHHMYSLARPDIAAWIIQGIDFVEARNTGVSHDELVKAKELWSDQSSSAEVE